MHFWDAVGCGLALCSLFAENNTTHSMGKWIRWQWGQKILFVFLFFFFPFCFFMFCAKQLLLHPNLLISFKKRWAGLYWQVGWGGLGMLSSQSLRPTIQGGLVTDLTGVSLYYYHCFLYESHMSLTSCRGNPFYYWSCIHNKKQPMLH